MVPEFSECWPDGICCLASFRLRLNTAREFNTLMLMAFLVNAANVGGRTVRCPRQRGSPEAPVQHQLCWINRLPLLPWEIRWMLILSLNYLAKRGSLPLFLRRLLLIWNITLITVREWFQVGMAPTWLDCAGLSPELRSWQL